MQQELEPNKDKAEAAAIAEIEREHGKGSIFSLASRIGIPMPHIPTGIPELDDDVLGIGGLPKGRIVEILGPESSGKTTLALATIASAQAAGGKAAFIDAEHALDPAWMKILGVDVDNLLVSQPDFGEQALQIAATLVNSGAFDVVVVDSVAALVPKAELDGEIGDAHVGRQAKMMAQAMRMLTGAVSRSGTCLVFINQIRMQIGVSFGNPETSPGGRALRFAASVRLDVRRISQVKKGEDNIGNNVKIKAIKNKVSAPFREAEVQLIFGKGFDKVGSLIDIAIEKKLITKGGAWLTFGEQKWQGRDQLISAIEADPALLEKIKGLVGK